MILKIEKYLLLATIILGLAFVVLFYDFRIWSQVTDLHKMGADSWHLVSTLHPHSLRYLIIQPNYHISSVTGVHPNSVFTWMTGGLLVLIPIFAWLTFYFQYPSLSKAKLRIIVLILVATLYFSMGFWMNGRMIWAHFSVALLLLSAVLIRAGKLRPYLAFLLFIVAILMSSVTSGAFIVIWLAMVFFCGWLILRHNKHLKMRVFGLLLGLVVLISVPWFLISLDKNLTYYGGQGQAWLTSLQHGWGGANFEDDNQKYYKKKLTNPDNNMLADYDEKPKDSISSYFVGEFGPFISVAAVLALVCLVFAYSYWRRLGRVAELKVGFSFVALVVGLYGFSALTLAALPYVYLAAMIGDHMSLWSGDEHLIP
jgi:hypothetical protein